MELDFGGGEGVDGGETVAGGGWGFIVFEVLERLDHGESLVDAERPRPERQPTHLFFCSSLASELGLF